MYLFFDTETTGLLDFAADLRAPHQPRVVQLGALLTDPEGAPAGELDVLIRPDGWSVPDEAARVHGITTARCEAGGIPVADALARFGRLEDACSLRVAHNAGFDRRMLAREALALGLPPGPARVAEFCTMLASTPHCRLRRPGRPGFKWPTLREAHLHFFGREFDGAHDAMADVRACRDVFFALKGLGAVPRA